MSVCIVANPNSGSSDQIEALHELIRGRDDVCVRETTASGDAERIARQAVDEGFGVVVAAGGDGTIKEVVNGIFAASRGVRLGVVPLGTGNDLARTLALPLDPIEAFRIIESGRRIAIDVMELQAGGHSVYGVNAAAGGFSGQVGEVLSPELKATWGPLAYFMGAAQLLPDITKYTMTITIDGVVLEDERVLNVIVANGRTIGGGRNVAPLANPEDGLLDVVVVRVGTVFQLADVGRRLLTGNYIDNPLVTLHRAAQVRVHAVPGMWFNIDGELFSNDPVSFVVHPAAIEVSVGPDYMASPETGSTSNV